LQACARPVPETSGAFLRNDSVEFSQRALLGIQVRAMINNVEKARLCHDRNHSAESSHQFTTHSGQAQISETRFK